MDQLNEATITSNVARAAWNYRNQGANFGAEAGLDTMRGANAATAGYMSGFSTLLSGAGDFSKKWSQFRNVGARSTDFDNPADYG